MATPPARHPNGTDTRPARIPAARNGRSLIFSMENAIGIVKVMVGPITLATIRPLNFPSASVSASSDAIGYPPISAPKSNPATTDGSAPIICAIGATHGFKTSDKNGAIAMIAATAKTSSPMVLKPSSNSLPYPSLFPRSLSTPPITIKIIMIIIIMEFAEIFVIQSVSDSTNCCIIIPTFSCDFFHKKRFCAIWVFTLLFIKCIIISTIIFIIIHMIKKSK